IDYSLLVVTRWREERANGLANDDAIHKAMERAGSAVVFSGTTVGIGLLALVVLPVPFLRSIGFAGMLIPIVSVAVAVTLLPVIPATHIAVGVPVPNSLAQTGPARQGLDMLESSGLGTPGFEPHMILVSGGKDPNTVAQAAATVPGMVTAVVPTGPGWAAPPGA